MTVVKRESEVEQVRHAIFTPNFGTFCDPTLVADLAARAESSGWDAWFLWDHVVHRLGDEPAVDPWITLAAIAMRTSRLRLGPMVTPIPRRRPWNVARQAVTLDQLSGGRVVLGVGIGAWGTPEFEGFGEEEDLVRRGSMLDEGLEVIASLWAGDEMHHSGEHYTVEGVRFRPPPVQSPLPVWVAAVWPNRRPLRLAGCRAPWAARSRSVDRGFGDRGRRKGRLREGRRPPSRVLGECRSHLDAPRGRQRLAGRKGRVIHRLRTRRQGLIARSARS
jgi:alkanesulfonate monooxygenase SsuD/methylene tetrahydromethanopterin reductase-like flavin-dependent oxidoreductase (luciferase family)